MQQVGHATRAAARISKGIRKMPENKVWAPMEASPEVMSNFLHAVGVPDNFEVRDIPTLEDGDDALTAAIRDPEKVRAVIFLLPKDVASEGLGGAEQEGAFFVRETFENSSGPVALINAVANNQDAIQLVEDSALVSFMAPVLENSPEERGDALGDNEGILAALTEAGTSIGAAGEEVQIADHRFVAIVAKDGTLYWIDGSREAGGPLAFGTTTPAEFPANAITLCRDVVAANPEIHGFSAFALAEKMD